MMNKFSAPGLWNLPSLIRKFILSWLLAATIEFYLLPFELRDLSLLSGLSQMSMTRLLLTAAVMFTVLCVIGCYLITARIERWAIASVFAIYVAGVIWFNFTVPFAVVCCLLLTVLVIYAVFGWEASEPPPKVAENNKKIHYWIAGCLALAFVAFVSAWLVGRYLSFSTPTYDFGIFSQMFYNMAEKGVPLTTLERDGLLSHFAVHVSPIYYLILPFYMLMPSPITLQVIQPLILATAIVPLWLIAKHHGLNSLTCVLLCAVLLLYPAYAGATSYDLHENCFLTPLLLWLLYNLEKKNWLWAAVFALLTLGVKEDAAVYVAVIGLWFSIRTILRYQKADRCSLIFGLAMIGASIGWFVAVTGYLSGSGDGVMTYRYDNFIYDGSASLMSVIKSVVLNPMKAVFECVDSQKLSFVAQTLLPLLCLPLLTRRFERYLLLIPYVLVNLMSDYQYQHDIFFQYTFGSTALLVYLTAVNLADIRPDRSRLVCLASTVALCGVFFGSLIVPKAINYPNTAVQYSAYYQQIRNVLDEIPEDASVTASTFYTTYLSDRAVVYDLRYCSKEHLLESDYIVIHTGYDKDAQNYASIGKENGMENLILLLQKNGYQLYAQAGSSVVIYSK